MKKNNNLFQIIFVLLIFLINIGSTTPDIIYWSEDAKLKWEDFNGTPRHDYEDISAITSSGIIHYTGCDDDDFIKFKVQAYFERNESWVKEEALTEHHLIHEQIHFDITELHARKIRKTLQDRAFKCGEEDDFNEFIKILLQNWKTDQRAYDILSRHSMDKQIQKEWFYKIEMELSLFSDFKKPESK